jgi:uncharacterized protein YkwD
MLRLSALLLAILLALAPCAAWQGGAALPPSPAAVSDAERRSHVAELTARLNEIRQRHGLAPVRHLPALDVSAQSHAEDMLRRDFFAHQSPEGKWASDRVERDTPRLIACDIRENIYMVGTAAQEPRAQRIADAYEGWMNSPGHRANILNTVSTHVGFGVASKVEKGRRLEYVVQVFAVGLGEWETTPGPSVAPGQTLSARMFAPAKFFLASLDFPRRPFEDPREPGRWFVGGTPLPQRSRGSATQLQVPAVPEGRYELRVTHEDGANPGFYRLRSINLQNPRR